jgi:hypothetical protein
VGSAVLCLCQTKTGCSPSICGNIARESVKGSSSLPLTAAKGDCRDGLTAVSRGRRHWMRDAMDAVYPLYGDWRRRGRLLLGDGQP